MRGAMSSCSHVFLKISAIFFVMVFKWFACFLQTTCFFDGLARVFFSGGIDFVTVIAVF